MSHKLKKAEKRFINAENTMKGLTRKGLMPSAGPEAGLATSKLNDAIWAAHRAGSLRGSNVKTAKTSFAGTKIYFGNHQVKYFPETGEIRLNKSKKLKKDIIKK